MIRTTPAAVRLLTLLALGLSAEVQLTACKGGSEFVDTAAPDDSEPVIDTAPPGCAAPVWRDRGTLGAEATGGYLDVAVSDTHVIVIDNAAEPSEDGDSFNYERAAYAVERELLVGAEYGVHFVTNADAIIEGPLDRVQVIGHQLVLGRGQGAVGDTADEYLGGNVAAIDVGDIAADYDGKITDEGVATLTYWNVQGSEQNSGAQSADFDTDVTGDGVLDLIVRVEGGLMIFSGATMAEMTGAERSALAEDQAWGILEMPLPCEAAPVDTAVFGTGAAGQGVLAVSCPPDSEDGPAGALHLYDLPLAPPSGDYPPPNDITEENEEVRFGLKSGAGGVLVSEGIGRPLFAASPGMGRVLELDAPGVASDTLTQRYVFSPEAPGTTEGVGRFGAAVALVRDGAGCVSLVVTDPAYPLSEGEGYGVVYGVPVDHATASSAVWSSWKAPYGALMTDPKHALGSTLAVSPDGSFVAVGSAIGADGWRTQLNVLSVE